MVPPTAGAGNPTVVTVVARSPTPARMMDTQVQLGNDELAASPTDAVTDAAAFTLDGLDDDLVADFAAVGISVGPFGVVADDAAKRAAAASIFLKLAAEADAELAAEKAAMLAQVEIIMTHYDRRMSSIAQRRGWFLRSVESIAKEAAAAGDFGKKKSAETPWGGFGVRDRSASVEMVDSAALLAHLMESAPEHVRVAVKLPLAEARQYLSPTELERTKMEPAWGDVKKSLDPDGALPPGVAAVPAARVPFAKPNTIRAIVEGVR